MQNSFWKNFFSFIIFLVSISAKAQVYINEIDSDSPGIDVAEFVEIRTILPNTNLSGYTLVFYNGNAASSTANASYYTIDLSNLTTDINGIVTIGSVGVAPVPNFILADNIIQNGEDAVALYQAPASLFPDGTIAHDTNLVDALAYDTGDPDAVALMALLGITVQSNENENNLQSTESVQRNNNGTYTTKAPTPGALNDGSGIPYNGITISANTMNKNEGDTLKITFTTQNNVTTPLTFSFTLNSGSFNSADFSGLTNVTIPIGSNTFTTTITTIDDILDEGDETLKIKFGTLPSGFNRLNDFIEIRIVDNDFKVDPWGPPTAATYGIVNMDAPTGYYNSLNGLSGNALKQALQNIIADSIVVRSHTYGDVYNILKEADHNPKNGNEVCLLYTELTRSKLDLQTSGSGTGKWNREHIYPQSRGGFTNGTPDLPDGINIYLPSNANDLMAGHSDAHHLRAEDAIENSTRNNSDFGQDYNGPPNNKGYWKGDVARSLFYMAVRYNALSLVAGNPDDTTKLKMGDLDSLLKWNTTDPRDDFEMNRNNYIYSWQKNRNPFIDYPVLADYIWGTKFGQPFYFSTDAISNQNEQPISIYPNPTKQIIYIDGCQAMDLIQIYNSLGHLVKTQKIQSNNSVELQLPAGIYFVKVASRGKIWENKIQVAP
jgi:Endonuclease I/Secretion system C-terminal sorting domain